MINIIISKETLKEMPSHYKLYQYYQSEYWSIYKILCNFWSTINYISIFEYHGKFVMRYGPSDLYADIKIINSHTTATKLWKVWEK